MLDFNGSLHKSQLKLGHWSVQHPMELCRWNNLYIDGLMQDCSISSALAMEILQCCTKLSICYNLDVGLACFWVGVSVTNVSQRNAIETQNALDISRDGNGSGNGLSLVRRQVITWTIYWGWDKMVAISQTTFPNTFSWNKMFGFQVKFY